MTTSTIPSMKGAPTRGLPARTIPSRDSRIEGIVQVLIVIAVGTMAGAASFTHVHDWTMTHSPAGTHDWFGWANAVISELTPLAAGLEIRRRKRNGQLIGYPMAVLIAAAALSLSAQVAVATPSASGRLLSAVPALAFLALVKLVLARTPATPTPAAELAHAPSTETAQPASTHRDNTVPALIPAVDAAPMLAPITTAPASVEVPAHLLAGATFAANTHRSATGRAITADDLAARMNITPALGAQLLAALEPPRVNGTPINGAPVGGAPR